MNKSEKKIKEQIPAKINLPKTVAKAEKVLPFDDGSKKIVKKK
jgi:hypothetical protein